MATNITGTDVILEIDTVTAITAARGTDANYKAIACLVTNGIELSFAEQSTSNKCDGGFANSESGMGSWSFTADGQAVEDIDSAQVNYQTLFNLALNKTKFWMRMTNPDNGYYREGVVRISQHNETAPNQEVLTFTSTFTGQGQPLSTPGA